VGTNPAIEAHTLMTDTISRLVQGVLFAMLAVIGMGMALVFMISTAIAVGVLYIVARVRGKPFGVRAYWDQRRGGQKKPGFGDAAGGFAAKGPFARQSTPKTPRKDIIDVEVREVQ